MRHAAMTKTLAMIVLALGLCTAIPSAERMGYPAEEFTARRQKLAKALGSGTVLHWHPGVRFALTGETVLVQPEGPEWLTVPDQWPMLGITVKGEKHSFPDVLCRETATGWE